MLALGTYPSIQGEVQADLREVQMEKNRGPSPTVIADLTASTDLPDL